MDEYIDAEGDYLICPYCGAKIDMLKEIAVEYPGKTIENIIVQLEARLKELN